MLSEAECRQIESTLLPALERHHLRLLAHALRTLQTIAGRSEGSPPTRRAIAEWARSQPMVRDDPAFAESFIEQLINAAHQLETIAGQDGSGAGNGRGSVGAMGLDLEDLVAWVRRQADRRIAGPPLRPSVPGAIPPPA
jgi:hypothetical protein